MASDLGRRLRALPDVEQVLLEPAELFVYEADGLTVLRGQASAVVFPVSTEGVVATGV